MQQGHSGSIVRRVHCRVEKLTSDQKFAENVGRQRDLIDLSRRLTILPRIRRVSGNLIVMEFIKGSEGLTKLNAERAGQSLRLLQEQEGFSHPCLTGIGWLIELANTNLERAGESVRVPLALAADLPDDALIHSEPTQLIEADDGRIVFIDVESIGRGSRYQDLGFVAYASHLTENPEMFDFFMKGYCRQPISLDEKLILRAAAVIALAYSRFADTQQRLGLGIHLMRQSGLI